jgi:hypothetical protein
VDGGKWIAYFSLTTGIQEIMKILVLFSVSPSEEKAKPFWIISLMTHEYLLISGEEKNLQR